MPLQSWKAIQLLNSIIEPILTMQTFNQRSSSHRIDRFTLFLAVCAVIGATLVLARQATFGVGLHQDSTVYISAARHLLAGNGLVEFSNQEPYLQHAPLYPLLLAASSIFIFDPRDAAGPLNAIIFGLIIFISGRWLIQHIQSRLLAIWGCIAITISIPLATTAYSALSEPLFILFVMLSLIQTDHFLRNAKTSSLIWSAVFAALACLTRYPGVALIIAVIPLLILPWNGLKTQKTKQTGLYVAIAALPLLLWLLRNFLISGQPAGDRKLYERSQLTEILDSMLSDVATYVLVGVPLENVPLIAAVAAGVALLLMSAYFIRSLLRSYISKTYTFNSLQLFTAFAFIFLLFFIIAALISYVEPLYGRMLVPVYIPMVFVALLALDKFLIYDKERNLLGTLSSLPIIGKTVRGNIADTSTLFIVVIVALLLWTGFSIPANADSIRETNIRPGGGRDITRILGSEVIRYLPENQISGSILTNVYEGPLSLYPFTRWHRLFPDMNQWQRHEMQMFIEDAPGDVYVVWMDNTEEPNPFRNPQQTVLPDVELIADLSDGTVLKVPKLSWDEGAYRVIVSREPAVRSNYDLHLDDGHLHYVKEQCNDEDIESPFFLHIIPTDLALLPGNRQALGFDNLDFGFYAHGNRSGVRCMASVPLPDYSISSIKTGQWIRDDDRQIWSEELILGN